MAFILTPRQKSALKLLTKRNANNVLGMGGSRSGKTILFLYAIIARALKCPGSRHTVIRNINRDCRRLIGMVSLPELHAMLSIKVEYDKTSAIYRYPGGSEVWLVGLDDAGHRDERVLGSEFSTALIEEATEVPYESTLKLRTRISQKNKLMKRIWYSCNPPSRLHWLYRLFVEKVDPVDRLSLTDPDNYHTFQMNPADNATNIDPGYLLALDSLPARQRIRFRDGEWGSPDEGVLWRAEWIVDNRVQHVKDELVDIVVAVDPSCGGTCETGIVAVGRGTGGHLYIIADRTSRGTPAEWALAATSLAKEVGASRIVAESNQGGEMVAAVIRNANPALAVELVHAGASKRVRAEPVAALAERGMVHHVGTLVELEDQLLSWAPGSDSPDRLDAMVHGCAALLLQGAGATPQVAATAILGAEDEAVWNDL